MIVGGRAYRVAKQGVRTAAGLWLAAALCRAGCASVEERDLRSSVPHEATQAASVQTTAPPAALRERLTLLASRYGICHADLAVIRNRELQSVDAGHGCADYDSAYGDNVFQAASLSAFGHDSRASYSLRPCLLAMRYRSDDAQACIACSCDMPSTSYM